MIFSDKFIADRTFFIYRRSSTKRIRTATMLASSAAVRLLARSASRHTSRLGAVRCMGGLEAYEDYGKACFTGAVADEYLQKQGASGDLLKDPSWTKTHSDVVAAAVLDWCVSLLDMMFYDLLGRGLVRGWMRYILRFPCNLQRTSEEIR